MSEPIDQLQQVLQARGYNMTRPRRTVFEALLDTEPQSMHELVARLGTIDRASVYRTITLFEALGIVQRLQMGWKYKLELTGQFMHHHHHLTCTNCGTVIPLPEDADLEKRLHRLAARRQFNAQDHQLEIRGRCVNCTS